jgi:hypothetical protein
MLEDTEFNSVDDARLNLRFVALLWEMFVEEVRWFWDQAIPLPRMPPAAPAADAPQVYKKRYIWHTTFSLLTPAADAPQVYNNFSS